MSLRQELEQENAAALRPFDGTAPFGVDASFLPEFESVKAELDKLGAIAGGTPDWETVGARARRLLETTTKDWRLACWLATAEARTKGARGLASGLLIVSGFTTSLWAGFPDAKRLRGRGNLFAWLTDQLTATIEAWQVTAADRESVGLADTLIREIDGVLQDKLGDAHPGPGRLRNIVANLVRAVPAEALPVAPLAPASPAQAVPPAPAPSRADAPVALEHSAAASEYSWSSGGPPIAAPKDAVEATSALKWMSETMIAVANALRAEDFGNALAYRVHREALWMWRGAPAVARGARTYADAPKPRQVDSLASLAASENFKETIEAVEFASTRNPWWLDLHRMCGDALERLGHREARAEVGFQIVKLTQRVPSLLQLQFENGTPLASPETMAWVEGEQRKYGGSAGTGASQADQRTEEALAVAQGLLGEGRLGDGLSAAVSAALRMGSGRERFMVLLRTGRLALERGAPRLARPMLEGLLDDAEHHRLEVWDPGMCVELYRTLIQAMRAEKGANVDPSQREALLFEKLCRLDPAAALVLAGG